MQMKIKHATIEVEKTCMSNTFKNKNPVRHHTILPSILMSSTLQNEGKPGK